MGSVSVRVFSLAPELWLAVAEVEELSTESSDHQEA